MTCHKLNDCICVNLFLACVLLVYLSVFIATVHAVLVTIAFFSPPKFFLYFWLLWVFVAVCGLSLVVASGHYSSLQCAGFSLRWLLPRAPGHVGFSSCGTKGLRCSTAFGIFPDQGLNQCLLHWQVDSHPLYHQGCLTAVS